LLTAAQLGAGFELVSINQEIVLARAPGGYRVGRVADDVPIGLYELTLDAADGSLAIRDAIWASGVLHR
jgi:hypothetical protein